MSSGSSDVIARAARRGSAQKGAAPAPKWTTIEGLTVAYTDEASLRTARKDIFEQRIYHFEPATPSPLIIDGGAHVGMAAMYWKWVMPAARIVCFEPDGGIAALLRKNLSVNGLTGVEVIEAGLAAAAGEAAFCADGSDGGRLVTEAGGDADWRVPTVRLSDHVREPVELLKLNIEGQEWPVLSDLEQAGRLGLVRRIILEYHGWPVGRQSLGDILNLLDRAGYRYIVHDFDRETNPATKPPFRIRNHAPWFCLVYAERAAVDSGTSRPPHSKAPPIVEMGGLRRVTPVSRVFGLDRGTAIDRHYIETFLAAHASDICGRVLEIGDCGYTRRFGGEGVSRSDVLHAAPGNRQATLVGDLATGAGIPREAFDCIILTQTLLCIEDVRSAIANCARALAPGGVVLATVPGISQVSRYDMDRWGDWWRFTTLSARRLFESAFGAGNVAVEAFGNVLAATGFLQGMAAEELTARELEHRDADYELVITIRARRAN